MLGTYPSVCKNLTCTYFTHHVILGYFILCIIYLTLKLFREKFFQDCGKVIDVRLASHKDGKLKGFGHVEFASAEAAQYVSS
jgi:RNA recognition motif-containing protein